MRGWLYLGILLGMNVSQVIANISHQEDVSSQTEKVFDAATQPSDQQKESHPSDLDAIYLKAFGQLPALPDKPLEVSFNFDDQPEEPVMVKVQRPLEETLVRVVDIQDELDDLAVPKVTQLVHRLATGEGYISLKKLRQIGIEIDFDPYGLTLTMNIPPELQKVRKVSLRHYGGKQRYLQPLENSAYNAYLNVRTSTSYLSRGSVSTGQRLRPLKFNLESAINIHDFVLESTATFTQKQSKKFVWGDVRLVHDLPTIGATVSLGDLSYSTKTYQSFQKMAGIGYASNFLAQGLTFISPSGSRSFVLDTKSKVDVYVNEQLVRTLNLKPGRYDLQDFPFIQGANDVRLKITDRFGRVAYIDFPFFFNSQLLAKGLDEFSYNIGFPLEDPQIKKYDLNNYYVSLFHRVGVTDFMTIGGGLQASRFQGVLTGNVLWENALGTWLLEGAGSQIYKGQTGGAFTLQYLWHAQDSGNSVGVQVAGMTRRFASLGSLTPNNLSAYQASVRYNFSLPWDVRTTVSVTTDVNKKFRNRKNSQSIFLRKSFQGPSFSLTLTRTKEVGKKVDLSFLVGANIPLGDHHHVNYDYDSGASTTNIEYDYTPDTNIGTFDFSAKGSRSPTNYQNTLHTDYTGNRFTMDIDHQTDNTRQWKMKESRTTVNFGTALVFADGHFGVSRPISNSFVIVKPVKALQDKTLYVEPVTESVYSAESTAFGPAIVPALSPYQRRTINLDTLNLPVGVDVPERAFVVKPFYKSATVIEVGTDALVTGIGNLAYEDGLPVKLLAGEIHDVDDPTFVPIKTFTNKRGRFTAPGLKPGRYRLELYDQLHSVVAFEIPDNTQGLYRLGTLIMKSGEKA